MEKLIVIVLTASLFGCAGNDEGVANSEANFTHSSDSQIALSSETAMVSSGQNQDLLSSNSSLFASSSSSISIIDHGSSQTEPDDRVEAENYVLNPDVESFEIIADGVSETVFVKCSASQSTPLIISDDDEGRLLFPFIASRDSVVVGVVVDVQFSSSNSFYYRIWGASDWKIQTQYQSDGFESIDLLNKNGGSEGFSLNEGEGYTLELRCREAGVMFDSVYLRGANFGGGGYVVDIPSSNSSASSAQTSSVASSNSASSDNVANVPNLLYGEEDYLSFCSGCHGRAGDGRTKIDRYKASYQGLSLNDFIEIEMPYCPYENCAINIAAYIKNGFSQ